jgi:hypothetical protein
MNAGTPENATIDISVDRAINYAFQQNAIPVIKELRLRNDDKPRGGLLIRITTEPAFAEPAGVRLQNLDAAQESRVAPVDLKLSHDFLVGLSEKVPGWLRVEVVEQGSGPTGPSGQWAVRFALAVTKQGGLCSGPHESPGPGRIGTGTAVSARRTAAFAHRCRFGRVKG